MFLEAQKRGVRTPTAHLLFYSPKPTTANQLSAEGDTAWVPPERPMLGAACSGWPSAVCQPQDIYLTLCFPPRGRTWLQPPTPTARSTRTPCFGAAPSQPPGAAPGEGRDPADPLLRTQALHCLAHSRFFRKLWEAKQSCWPGQHGLLGRGFGAFNHFQAQDLVSGRGKEMSFKT